MRRRTRVCRRTYLSKVEGARIWWGDAGAKVFMERFGIHLKRVNATYGMFDKLVRHYGGVVFSYKMLLEKPESVLAVVMGELGLEYIPQQLNYFSGGRQSKIRGDVALAKDPKPVDVRFHHRREEQAMQVSDDYYSQPDSIRYDSLDEFVGGLDEAGLRVLVPGDRKPVYRMRRS